VTVVDATVLRRGNIRIEGQRFPISATTVTNVLIGLRDDPRYLKWIESMWPGLVTRRQLRHWLSDGVPVLLAAAADQLREDRTLPYGKLAPLLEEVEHAGPSTITVPSLPALAAWALSRAGQSAAVSICGECGLPWISRTAVDYCYRPAPGKTMTCAQLHAHVRFAEQRAEWNREYRRIYARKLRGTVSEEDWKHWRTDATWLRKNANFNLAYDMWKALRQHGSPQLAQLRRAQEDEYGEEEVERIVTELIAEAEEKER
jgi:hypothetical protein